MDMFPDEVLLHIFSELPLVDLICNVRLVSWRWYYLSKDSSLWTDVDLSYTRLAEDDKDQNRIHRGLRDLLFSIQNSLQSLTFGCVCHDGGIYELFGSAWKRKNKARFPALRFLDYSYSYVSPRNLRVAITTHPDIEELILCHTSISLSEAMTEALHLPNLKVLVFQDSSAHWFHEFYILQQQVIKVAKTCTKLEIVELHTIQADLDNRVIQQFTKHCPNLKSLSLTCSSRLSAEAFTFINTEISCITSLELWDRQRTEPYLHFVLPWFPHLTHLAVNGHCVHLEDCTAIADCCPKLEELIFHASPKSIRPQGLFDQFLGNNVNSLCGLELLTVVEKCRNLRKLHAPHSNIDDESVVGLTEKCPHLEDVNFSECSRLTKVSLWALSKNSPNLRKLHFQENSVSHEHLICVLIKCRKLYEVFFDRSSSLQMVSAPPEKSPTEGISRDTSNISLSNLDDIPFIDMATSAEDTELRDMLLLNTSTGLESNPFDYPPPAHSACLPFNHDPPAKVLYNYCPIKRLALSGSEAEEKFLTAIVNEVPSVTLLHLDGAEALTDDLVITIAKNCPHLVSLGLNFSVKQTSESKFGDKGLTAVINYCRKLECLSFLNNRNITSGAVQLLFHSLETTLRSLDTVSLCVGQGFACSPSVVALYGLKYLTEDSKKQLKSAATKSNASFFIHLDFKKKKGFL